MVPYPDQGSIYLYENSGLYKEMQVIASVNSRLNRHLTLNGYYAFSDYHTNTFGFPTNEYDTAVDWGRASGVPLNSAYVIGSIGLPYRWVVSPSISASSSTPFNITTGTDVNGDGIFNDRPSFAPPRPRCGGNIVCTRVGDFDLAPGPGEATIPINYGDGPDQYRVDMRFSRTLGWRRGPQYFRLPPPDGTRSQQRPFRRVLEPIPSTNARYNMGLTVQATDIFNHVDLSNPQGRTGTRQVFR